MIPIAYILELPKSADASGLSPILRGPLLPESGMCQNMQRNAFLFVAYHCSESSETRGRTTQERKQPCGHGNILKTRYPPNETSSHQRKCENCQRWMRLNGGNTRIFSRREDAEKWLEEN